MTYTNNEVASHFASSTVTQVSSPASLTSSKISPRRVATATITPRRKVTTRPPKRPLPQTRLAAQRQKLYHGGRRELNEITLDADEIQELLSEAELKRQRLARKAELARRSRQRNKCRIQQLEAEVRGLRQALGKARAERHTMLASQHAAAAGAALATRSVDVRQDLVRSLSLALPLDTVSAAALPSIIKQEHAPEHAQAHPPASGSTNGGLSEAVKSAIMARRDSLARSADSAQTVRSVAHGQTEDWPALLTRLVDILHQDGDELLVQFQHLQKTLDPCVVTHFLHWCLSHNDKFYVDPDGLWLSLMDTIRTSEQQKAELASIRAEIGHDKPVHSHLKLHMQRFKVALHNYARLSQAQLENLQSVLTPEQLAKLLVYDQPAHQNQQVS